MSTRRHALPFAVVGLAALTLGTAAASYRAGHAAGQIEGRAAAYRQTDAVLRDLERALAPLVQQQAQDHESQTAERMP